MPPVNSDNPHEAPNNGGHKDSGQKASQKDEPRSPLGPLENLQRRYADQLSDDIETLETVLDELADQKDALESEILSLRQESDRLRTEVNLLEAKHAKVMLAEQTFAKGHQHQGTETEPEPAEPQRPSQSFSSQSFSSKSFSSKSFSSQPLPSQPDTQQRPHRTGDRQKTQPDSAFSPTHATEPTAPGPILPGETEAPARTASPSGHDRVELPVPATSQQQRATTSDFKPGGLKPSVSSAIVPVNQRAQRRGLVLGAIAALLAAWHYHIASTLIQGGSWLGLPIGALGTGFVPAAALLWLRMLVIIPAMVLLAPQIHRRTWDDLQTWFNARERVLTMVVGSGVALFLSQILIYQSMGTLGAVVGTSLFFLYPLTATPLGIGIGKERALSPFALLALVAIAMGALLVIRPLLGGETSPAVGTGLLASLAFSIYVVLTNLSHRQQCHPIPVAMAQFSTMAVLSSLVLLLRPLTLESISWLSLSLWGILLGCAMLLVYLFNYSSLRAVGPRTAIVAAATPLLTLLIAWGFQPAPNLEIIQWTGIFLVSVGGIALGKEKLGSR